MGDRELLKSLEKYRAKATDKIIEPPKILTLDLNNKEYILATEGNISCVAGKQKSKKTFFTSSMAAALASEKGRFYRLVGHKKGKAIFFDTEQSDYHTDKVLRRVLRCAGKPHENIDNGDFLLYRLKSETYKRRREIIDYVINNIPDVAIVVIDGIRDLIKDPNNWDEAGDIIDWVSKLAEKNNCHIVNILHFNKGVDSLRGALGTEMQNKAETVIQVEKVTGTASKVLPRDCRNEEFPAFGLRVNRDGLPVILDSEPQDPNSKNNTGNDKPMF